MKVKVKIFLHMLSFLNRLCCFPNRNKKTTTETVSDVVKRNNIISSFTNDFSNVEWNNTTPFVPPIKSGYVIKVYDGDTITIAAKMPYMNSPIYRFSVRLNGIDCPEIKAKTFIEKELAINSRDALANKIMRKNVVLHNVSLDKYGRLLADVYCEGIHMNQWMLNNKFALPYDGGKKTRPSEWDGNEDVLDE
jgi:endonuclease YncB( thermonuclease family)